MDEQKLKEKLNPEQYRVLRDRETENAFSGKYWDHEERGWYVCAACDRALFSSLQKFDAGTGWPSFHKPLRKAHVEFHRDDQGQEVRCTRCQSHLGYLDDEHGHYRVNSAGLNFVELGEIEVEDGEGEEKEEPAQNETPKKSWAKNISFAVGGIAFGIAVGVGAAPATPSAVCIQSPTVQVQTPTATPTPRITPVKTPTPAPSVSVTPAPGTGADSGSLPSSPATR